MSVAQKLQLILKNIESAATRVGRNADDINLIAVSKTRSVEDVQALIDEGFHVFGENTIQDAMTKIAVLASESNEWHFIGHLQSKKVKSVPGNFKWLHTIDSIKLAEKLSSAFVRYDRNESINCLIQVNVSGETTKSGVAVTELEQFVEKLLALELPRIRWRGLMTIGVQGNEVETRKAFATLRQCLHECNEAFSLDQFDQLSMGMSADYQIAIEEGATMIRVGTSLFGVRNK